MRGTNYATWVASGASTKVKARQSGRRGHLLAHSSEVFELKLAYRLRTTTQGLRPGLIMFRRSAAGPSSN